MVANVALLVAATWLFRGANVTTARREAEKEQAAQDTSAGFASHQIVTLICIAAFILFVIVGFSLGLEPDIGVFAFGFGAVLALLYPEAGAEGIRRIDWSTAFMVGGIVTFVGVLQRLDAVNLLGHAAMTVGTPLMAAFVICMIRRAVSALRRPRESCGVVPMSVHWRRRCVAVGH